MKNSELYLFVYFFISAPASAKHNIFFGATFPSVKFKTYAHSYISCFQLDLIKYTRTEYLNTAFYFKKSQRFIK